MIGIGIALLLSALAVTSWAIDFEPIAREFAWLVQVPAGCPKDLLFGAGLCTGFTIAASAAWSGVFLQMLTG